MNTQSTFWDDIKKRIGVIILITLFFGSLAFAVSTILPQKYRSDVKIIVIQKQFGEKVDAFSATKSAEFLSNILTRVVYTNTFFEDVQAAPFDVRKDFPAEAEERMKAWKRAVKVKKINNTGIITFSVYDVSRAKAQGTAEAIAWNVSTNGEKYHGGGKRVEIKTIDGPQTTILPASPNIVVNSIGGLMTGLAAALALVYFYPQARIFGLQQNREVDMAEGEIQWNNVPEPASEVSKVSEAVYETPAMERVGFNQTALKQTLPAPVATEMAEHEEEITETVTKEEISEVNLETNNDEKIEEIEKEEKLPVGIESVMFAQTGDQTIEAEKESTVVQEKQKKPELKSDEDKLAQMRHQILNGGTMGEVK